MLTFESKQYIFYYENTHKGNIMITKYDMDRDVPKEIWAQYLKKYADKYQMSLDGDGFWCLKCKRGRIGTYSMLKERLFYTTNELSPKAATCFLKRIRKEHEKNIVLGQRGDCEFSINFDEKYLPFVVKSLELYKKMNLSVDEKHRRKEQAIKNFNKTT